MDASTRDTVAIQVHENREAGADINTRADELAQSPTATWMPMAGWGEPRPQQRPRAPRASQEDLPPGNVIVDDDDGTGVREEFRRPRRSRQDDFLNHDYCSGSGSAV